MSFEFKQQLLYLQPPYPIIACKGFLYTQLATLMVKKGDLVCSYPIVADPPYIDGQIDEEWLEDDIPPVEYCRKIDCTQGDTITWKHFIRILHILGCQHTNWNIAKLYFHLDRFNIKIKDVPNYFSVRVTMNDDDKLVFECDSENLALYEWDEDEDTSYYKSSWRVTWSFLENVGNYLMINNEAKFIFVYDNKNEILRNKVAQVIKNIKAIKERNTTKLKTFDKMPRKEYVELTQLLLEMQGKQSIKEMILQKIRKEFMLDESSNDEIWGFIENMFDIEECPQNNDGNKFNFIVIREPKKEFIA